MLLTLITNEGHFSEKGQRESGYDSSSKGLIQQAAYCLYTYRSKESSEILLI